MARKGALTRFGKMLRELGESREVYTWQEITDRLHAVGWDGTRATLSNWAHGRYDANHLMLPYFIEAFDLTEEEKRDLAEAFAYGQSIISNHTHA